MTDLEVEYQADDSAIDAHASCKSDQEDVHTFLHHSASPFAKLKNTSFMASQAYEGASSRDGGHLFSGERKNATLENRNRSI